MREKGEEEEEEEEEEEGRKLKERARKRERRSVFLSSYSMNNQQTTSPFKIGLHVDVMKVNRNDAFPTLIGCTGVTRRWGLLPYTWVNKRIRLVPKLQGNVRLLPNMRLIMKTKIDTPQNRDAFLVACA